MTTVQQTGDWARARRVMCSLPSSLAKAQVLVLNEEAELLAKTAREGLASSSPGGARLRPLSPLTLATRRVAGGKRGGGDSPLYVSGQLAKAVVAKRVGRSIFVGVSSAVKSDNGRRMSDIAAINENGSAPIVIPITPKMAAFLAVVFKAAGMSGAGSGQGVIVLRIPPRPFLKPAFNAWSKDVVQRANKRLYQLVPEFRPGGG